MAQEQLGISTIREKIRFQEVSWSLERIAWVILALVPLAALTGIFAHGVVSDKIARAPNASLSVEYERYQRQSVQARFVIRIPSAQSGEIGLRLSPSFQQTYDIQSLQPAPLRSRASPQGLELFFHPPEAGELVAVIWSTPRNFGSVDLEAQTDSSGPLKFPVFIHP